MQYTFSIQGNSYGHYDFEADDLEEAMTLFNRDAIQDGFAGDFDVFITIECELTIQMRFIL